MIRVICAAIAAFLMSSQLASAASFTVFTDRVAFEAAVGTGLTTETFNSAASDISFSGSSTTFGQLTLSADDTAFPGNNKIDAAPLLDTINVNGSAAVNFFTRPNDNASIAFDAPVLAFGADFFNFNDEHLRTQISVLGNLFSPDVTDINEVSFFGIISDQAFSSVLFSALDYDVFGMDNVSFSSSISVVPLPAALPLMAGALAIMGLFGWRKKSS